MVVYVMKRFPCRMDTEIHYLSLAINLSKWACRERGGGVDSTTKGRETGMPISAASICFNNGCPRHM